MRNFLIAAALSIASLAHAGSASPGSGTFVDVSKITPEQAAQIQKQVNELQAPATNVSVAVREEAEAWGTLGANMGKAMVGAAREVGVAANDFAATDLGKVTVAIITYKLVGKELISVVAGSAVLFAGACLVIFLLRTRMFSVVEYEYHPVLFGFWQRRFVKSCRPTNDGVTIRIVCCAATAAISLLVGLQTIL